jgi:hypothetical protein
LNDYATSERNSEIVDQNVSSENNKNSGSVRLPLAAVMADKWEPIVPTWRVVFGATRDIAGAHGVVGTVRPTVIQFADGTVDDGTRIEPPVIHIQIDAGEALTAVQTRQLAQLLIGAATEAEQMAVGRP